VLITSAANPEIKNLRKLLADSGYRCAQKAFVIEGFKIFQFAKNIQKIYLREDAKLPAALKNLPCVILARRLFNSLSGTDTPQGILAVCAQPAPPPFSPDKKYIFLDRLQDPGNLGTIIRTAAALGLDGVICNKGGTDVFAPKVVRASMGAVFTLDILFREITELSGNIIAADLQGSAPEQLALKGGYILAIGSEGAGLSPEVLAAAGQRVSLPFDQNRAESLNAAVSAGILLYLFQIYSKK
jgi:TrmH family RNA methyltransferase